MEFKKVKLKEIATIEMGQSPKSMYYNENGEGLPFLQGVRTFGEIYPTIDTYTTKYNKVANRGDILFTVRAPVGDINIAPMKLCIGRGLASISSNNQDFLFYLLKNNKNMYTNYSTGTIYDSINKKELENLEFRIPDENSCDKIARVLKTYDQKIETNNKIIANLEAQAQAIFKYYFVDFEPFRDGKFIDSDLGPIPEGWEVKKLKDVAIIKAGGDRPKEFSKNKTEEFKIPIYSNGIADNGLYGFTNKAKIIDESITVSARGTIGFICLRTKPYTPIVRLITVTPDERIMSAKFLLYVINNLKIQGVGTTQKQLTVPDFSNYKFIMPNSEYIKKFTIKSEKIYDMIENLEEQNQTLAQTRDALLPKLMAGEIDLEDLGGFYD